MTFTSTMHTFDIELADVDRGVYETFALRVPRHPSETEEYLVTRVLAYCLEYAEGIGFSNGLAEPDEPTLAVRDLTGAIRVWIDVGAPDAARMHKAGKLAARVVVYTHKDPDRVIRQWSGARIHRAAALELYSFDQALLAGFVARLERRMAFALSVTSGQLYVTKEYVDVATALAELVGLTENVEFRQASATALPFDAGAFDVVWTEHVQMNIADKRAFYGEIARVLKPGGRLLFHDIFQGPGGEPHVPVPWAEVPSISFLAAPEDVRRILDDLGFTVTDWEDRSRPSLDWFVATVERMKASGPPPLGIHLLMGETARTKFQNLVRNLREERVVVFQAVAERR